MRPVVDDRPKPLALIGGRPFLDVLLGWLRREGVEQFVLCAGYGADAMRDALPTLCAHGRVRLSIETEPLGTGGALRHALGGETPDLLLALNGDSICPLDLSAMLEQHSRTGARLTVAVARANQMRDYGAIRLAGDGRIEAFAEKPVAGPPGWVNAGVYLLDAADFRARTPTGAFSLETDWFPRAAAEGSAFAFLHAGPFLDIGTPDRYRSAERTLSSLGLLEP